MLDVKPAIPLAGCLAAGWQSLCEPLAAVIESAVQTGLTAQRIYQDLVGEHQFAGSYYSVQRFVRQLRAAQPVPFARMEVEPGTGRRPAGLLFDLVLHGLPHFRGVELDGGTAAPGPCRCRTCWASWSANRPNRLPPWRGFGSSPAPRLPPIFRLPVALRPGLGLLCLS